jgi:acyl-CoA synthetase (AMP-forming)/AMP-acid ligase II
LEGLAVSLGRVVEDRAERDGKALAVQFEGTSLSYEALATRAKIVAGGLDKRGVGRGDVVAVLLHNRLEFIDVMLASAYLGAVFMPLNWRLASPELAYIVRHSGARMLVTEPEFVPLVRPIKHELGCGSYIVLGEPEAEGWEAYERLEASTPVTGPVQTPESDAHRLMYTSGTTARPKGVVISNGNLNAKCLAHIVELGLTREDRGLIAGPLYHVGALDLTFTTLLYLGAYQRVLRRFDPQVVALSIEEDRISTLWLAPSMMKALLDSGAENDLNSVRVVIDGGEKMPLPTIERILSRFPSAWYADAYGLTETVSGDTFLANGEQRRKAGSVGKPVFNLDLDILDTSGASLNAGEIGEIVLRGPKVFSGYWRDPEATSRAIRDGWFHTGDLGMRDAEGFLYIVDRLKDVIVSGGENIASLEVERVLYEHPDVSEVAVVAGPDSKWGEVPVAYVVLAKDSEITDHELIAFCAERIARFKVPAKIRLTEALPRTPSGKVLKRELRATEASATDTR